MTAHVRKILCVCTLGVLGTCLLADGTNPAAAYNERTSSVGKDDTLVKIINSLSETVRQDPSNASAIFELAKAYRIEGNFGKSLPLLDQYISLNPTNDTAYKIRATIYNATGRFADAIRDFNEGLKLNANDPYTLANRGFAFTQEGHYAEAVADFSTALKLDANNDEACNNLAWLRATCPVASFRNGGEAVVLATKACNLSQWRRGTRIDTLATAYAEAGDFSMAVKYEQMALTMNGMSKDDLNELRGRLALFQRHQAFRDKQPS